MYYSTTCLIYPTCLLSGTLGCRSNSDSGHQNFKPVHIFFILQVTIIYLVLAGGGNGEVRKLVNQVSDYFHALENPLLKKLLKAQIIKFNILIISNVVMTLIKIML